jgi:hypothetical protein
MIQYYILEHPTKGIVTDLPGHRDEKYHFSWSIGRRDERAERFFSITDARRHRDQLEGVSILISPPEMGWDWKVVQ